MSGLRYFNTYYIPKFPRFYTFVMMRISGQGKKFMGDSHIAYLPLPWRGSGRGLLFLLLLIPAVTFADNKDKNKKDKDKDKDKKKQHVIVPGRWRETVRMMPDSTKQVFYDTLFVHFQPRDSFTYRNGNGFVYDGAFTVSEDSILDLGSVRYKVLERTAARLVMMNAAGILHLVPDLSDTLKNIVIKKEDSARPVNNIDMMIGRWSVYKREADGPGMIDQADNIRSAFITGPSTDGKLGFIYSGKDPDSQPSWYITELGAGQSLNCAGRNSRTLKVLRCQDGDMILQENGIKYYFRIFR